MDSNLFEKKMRRGEAYHNLRVLDGNFIVIRLDGRGFSKLTKKAGFAKPFDSGFAQMMAAAMEATAREMGALYAYTESDEISILLPRHTQLFDREVEKLVSLSASVCSVAFNAVVPRYYHGHFPTLMAHFDARLWVGATEQDVVDYFSWRMADAERNSLLGLAYWSLRQRGLGKGAATSRLHGLGRPQLHDLLHEMGLNWNDLITWKKRGVGLRRTQRTFTAFNRGLKREELVTRSRIEVDWDIPYGDEYRQMIRDLVTPKEA